MIMSLRIEDLKYHALFVLWIIKVSVLISVKPFSALVNIRCEVKGLGWSACFMREAIFVGVRVSIPAVRGKHMSTLVVEVITQIVVYS